MNILLAVLCLAFLALPARAQSSSDDFLTKEQKEALGSLAIPSIPEPPMTRKEASDMVNALARAQRPIDAAARAIKATEAYRTYLGAFDAASAVAQDKAKAYRKEWSDLDAKLWSGEKTRARMRVDQDVEDNVQDLVKAMEDAYIGDCGELDEAAQKTCDDQRKTLAHLRAWDESGTDSFCNYSDSYGETISACVDEFMNILMDETSPSKVRQHYKKALGLMKERAAALKALPGLLPELTQKERETLQAVYAIRK